MDKAALLIVRLIAFLMAAWQPSEALAQDKDVQLWVYAIAQTDLDDDTRITFDATGRWREQRRGDEQQTVRFNLDHDAGDGFRIGGGFGVFEAGGATELRPHQEITWRRGPVFTRTRLEQRFFDQADRMELRLRQRIGYSHPVAQDLSIVMDGEYLGLVQTRSRARDAARDQWRARAIVQYQAGESVSVGVAYLFVYTPQPGRADQISHVPQILLTRRF